MKDKLLVIGTLIFAAIAVSFAVVDYNTPHYKAIDTTDQLNLGDPDANVQVVVFLDFRCGACAYYENQIFPLLNRRYIKPGKISYTLIPIAFLRGSSHLLEGYFCTREQNPNASFDYINTAYDTQNMPILPGINRDQLYQCLGSENASDYVDHNMEIAENAMGRRFATPSIFINGYRVKEISYTAISNAIDLALQGAQE